MLKSGVSGLILGVCGLGLAVTACGDDDDHSTSTGGSTGSGGASSLGGVSSLGGASVGNRGGTQNLGGAGAGGQAGNTGGSTALGGNASRGGSQATAGSTSSNAAGGGAGGAGAGGESTAGAGGEACVPRTCEQVGACDGQIQDGCGHTIACPACPSDSCPVREASGFVRRARSSGFSGTSAQYTEMYSIACKDVSTCLSACAARGGSSEMCAASECIMSTTDYCLPATVWTNLDAVTTRGSDATQDSAVLVLVSPPYRDKLLLDQFQLELPTTASIDGIEVTVRRAADDAGYAGDHEVRLLKSGVPSKLDRSKPDPWQAGDLKDVVYGGPKDLWGETWSVADVTSPEFGVSLATKYLQTAGNARAYVDFVSVKVYYHAGCK